MAPTTQQEPQDLLDVKTSARDERDGRDERIERAKRLKQDAERRANTEPASFANRRALMWMSKHRQR